jgi:hypothetical protein
LLFGKYLESTPPNKPWNIFSSGVNMTHFILGLKIRLKNPVFIEKKDSPFHLDSMVGPPHAIAG